MCVKGERKEGGMNAYSALYESICLSFIAPSQTQELSDSLNHFMKAPLFVITQPSLVLHKLVFLKIMCITSTVTVTDLLKDQQTARHKTHQSYPYVLTDEQHLWRETHRIFYEYQGEVGWEKNLVKELILLTLKICCLVALTQHIISSYIVLRCILLVKHRRILCKQYLQNYKTQEVRCASLVWPLRNLS